MKTILLIGASGFIGSALCDRLARSGHQVFALSRRSPVPTRIEGVESIVASQDNVAALADILPICDCVVHAASDSTPGDTALQPALEVDLNVRPALKFLEAMWKFKDIHLVYLSSAGALYQTAPGSCSAEDEIPAPRSNYGAGKLAVETFIGAAVRSQGGRATIVRPTNVYGPGQSFRPGFGIVPSLMMHAREGRAFKVWGNGTVERDYLYIDDLVQLCVRAIVNPASAGEVRCFNAGSSVATTTLDLIRLTSACTGIDIRSEFQPVRAVDAARIVVDCGRAARALGWRPEVKLAKGLDRTWLWYKSIRPER